MNLDYLYKTIVVRRHHETRFSPKLFLSCIEGVNARCLAKRMLRELFRFETLHRSVWFFSFI